MIKLTLEQKMILDNAIKAWGPESQLNMAFGECGEFVALCGRRSQRRDTVEDFLSEIADVTIMMAQMRELFGADRVDAMIAFKMDRLKLRLVDFYSNNKESE